MQKCVVCEGALNYCKTLYDDRFGYPGDFRLLSCGGCGHKSLDTQFLAEEIRKLYTEYYPRSHYSLDSYKPYSELPSFKSWIDGARSFAFRWVPSNVRVLDIGCGFGETLGYHKARGCDVYGVEADENIRRVAEKFDFKVHVGLFDPSIYEPEFFDYVTLDQVIEHVTDPLQVLKDIATVMKRDGTLILSTPNANGWGSRFFGRRWIHWHTPYHLQFFSEKSMRIAAEKAGLNLARMETVTDSYWLVHQLFHLMTRPKMGRPSVYWIPNMKMTSLQKQVFKLIPWVHRSKVNHVITRLFDAVGQGDNYLFFLRKKA